MAKLSPDDINRRLQALDGWRLQNDALVKQFVFGDFAQAIAFVSRLVPGAEAADHHPDITINYTRVTLSYSTHSEGTLTARDFAGAHMAARCAAADG